ncbi:MAG: hypothetical protein ACFFCF_07195 [Promethearchaeota archaeon]
MGTPWQPPPVAWTSWGEVFILIMLIIILIFLIITWFKPPKSS